MATKLIKKNKFAKELFSRKYKPRVIKPKKGKGSFKRKNVKVLHQFVELLLMIIPFPSLDIVQ